MANVLFYGYLAPYRIDIYNAQHERLGCEIYFIWDKDLSQNHDMSKLWKQCHFSPHYTKGIIWNNHKINLNIWSILSKEQPNLVIVPEFKILSIMVLLYRFLFRKKYKVIALCDDSFDMVSNNHEFTRKHRWARKIVAPWVDDIFLVDSNVVNWYQQRFNKGIWLPLIRDEKKELPLYESSKVIAQDFINKYDLANKKVLLFVGRFAPEKNLTALFEALKYTKEHFVTVLVGDGILKDELVKASKSINKEILFPGRFEGQSLRAWYLLSDVFILCSSQEAFGAVTNEALLAGCHCLVSKNCGSSCLITSNNGSIVDPNNIREIADSIDSAMKDVTISNRLSRDSKMPFTFSEMFAKIESKVLSMHK